MPMQSSSRSSFFLTRQSANVMEDLARHLKQAGAVCLLYGVKGVGKTRILQEFISTRFKHNKAIRILFNGDGSFQLTGGSGKRFQQENFTQQVLLSLPKQLVLVIDQVDNALPKVLNQVLKYWTANASGNGQKLVLCGYRDIIPELIESAGNLQLNINSVELNPLDSDGQIEYIRLRCCSGIRSYPVFSRQQKKRLKQTQGLFSKLELMLLDDIQCQEKPAVRRWKFPTYLLISLSCLAVLMVTAYWYQQNHREDDNAVDNQPLSSPSKIE